MAKNVRLTRREEEKRGLVKEHLIFCEGEDEKRFLIAYLNSPVLSEVPSFSQNIQVEDFGGNTDLHKALAVLKETTGFKRLRSLLIVRDAETNANAAVQSIRTALEKNQLAVPDRPCQWVRDEKSDLNIGFVLFPDCNASPRAGTLEDLCASILARPDAPELLGAVDGFLEHLEMNHNRKFAHKFKTRLHSYLSISDAYVGMKIGEAARANAFNWSHEALTSLRDFIAKKMCEAVQ